MNTPEKEINEIVELREKLKIALEKAEKWDELGEEISKFYLNEDGEYDEDNPENEGDLVSIGEIAASAYGWL